MKKWLISIYFIISCSCISSMWRWRQGRKQQRTAGKETESKEIKFGATAGPYSDMLTKAIIPGLEEKGYTVEITEFSDYIQPNNALDNGDIDANLFQHTIYLEDFAKQNNMDLTALITVPTAPMGIYSNSYKSLDEIKDGSTIAIPNDPTNAARAFNTFQDEGITNC